MRSMSQAERLIQTKAYGLEEPNKNWHFAKALNWYQAMTDDDEVRQYVVDYFKTQNRLDDIKILARVPDAWVPRTYAFVSRLILRDYDIKDDVKGRMEEAFTKMLSRAVSEENVVTEFTKPKPDVQQYIRNKVIDVAGEVNGLIDDGVVKEGWSFFDYLQKNNISTTVAKKLLDKYQEKLKSLENSKEEIDLISVYSILVNGANNFVSNTTKVRLPRKKKPQSIEKILKNFVYLKQHENLISINPEKIIKAQELWTFNPKYKTVTVYRAKDRGGLGVQWSSITNFDEETSFGKTFGRHTENDLQTILNGGKIICRKLMEDNSSKKLKVTRITKDTILLKVVNN